MPPTIPAFSTVGNTAGGALGYQAFNYGGSNLPLLTPDTPPNAIANNAMHTLTDGPPLWRTINSTVLSFDEKSIAFACIASQGGTGAVPKTIPCTIQLAGKKAGSGVTVVQDLVYNPGLLGTHFNKTAIAGSFSKLTEVDVSVVEAPVPNNLVTVLFDTHVYDAYLQ